jgi:putative PIN family toxin of toxin-antitoxin system
VLIRYLLSRRKGKKQNFNGRVVELWLVRKNIQLVLTPEIIEESLRVMDHFLLFSQELLNTWERRFLKHRTDVVSLGRRLNFSRDPNDNIFLAVADTGRADFLITNDRDLLDISDDDKRKLKFKIVTPKQFLDYWESLS